MPQKNCKLCTSSSSTSRPVNILMVVQSDLYTHYSIASKEEETVRLKVNRPPFTPKNFEWKLSQRQMTNKRPSHVTAQIVHRHKLQLLWRENSWPNSATNGLVMGLVGQYFCWTKKLVLVITNYCADRLVVFMRLSRSLGYWIGVIHGPNCAGGFCRARCCFVLVHFTYFYPKTIL